MGKEKKKKTVIVDAVLYLKNSRGTSAIGVMSENDTQIIFKSNGFTSIVHKDMLACIVTDNGKDTLKKVQDKPISGFEAYTKSGSAIGFNGWKLKDHLYVTKQGEFVEFYEDIIFLKKGPEDPKKNPPATTPKVEGPEEIPICVKCNQKVLVSDFKDDISLKEFSISKLCQFCQNEIFDEDEENQDIDEQGEGKDAKGVKEARKKD